MISRGWSRAVGEKLWEKKMTVVGVGSVGICCSTVLCVVATPHGGK